MGGFLQVLWFLPPEKTDCHDITEILLKPANQQCIYKNMYILSYHIGHTHTKILFRLTLLGFQKYNRNIFVTLMNTFVNK
jgi:hypothetical protein